MCDRSCVSLWAPTEIKTQVCVSGYLTRYMSTRAQSDWSVKMTQIRRGLRCHQRLEQVGVLSLNRILISATNRLQIFFPRQTCSLALFFNDWISFSLFNDDSELFAETRLVHRKQYVQWTIHSAVPWAGGTCSAFTTFCKRQKSQRFEATFFRAWLPWEINQEATRLRRVPHHSFKTSCRFVQWPSTLFAHKHAKGSTKSGRLLRQKKKVHLPGYECCTPTHDPR